MVQQKEAGQPGIGQGAANASTCTPWHRPAEQVCSRVQVSHLHACTDPALGCLPRQAQAKQAGQSSVEFALIVTTAIMMFLGMMQFGMYLYGLSIVENAARNGARVGATSQGCTPCDAAAAAQSALQGQPVIRDAAVSVLAPGGVVGSMVIIRVTAHIPMIMPGGASFGFGPLTTLSAESTFRQEGWNP